MAKIRFKCTCGKTLVVGEEHAGKVSRCPACQRPLKIPETDNAPRPKDIPAESVADQMADLARTAVKAQTQGKRIKQALAEIDQRKRRRTWTVVASVVGVGVLAVLIYPMFKVHGPTVEGIGAYPPEVQAHLEAFPSSDPRARAAAAWEAADVIGLPIVPTLAKFHRYPGHLVHIVVLRALQRLGPEVDPARIAAFLRDTEADLDVRMTAAFALGRRKKDADTTLREALRPHVTEILAGWPRWQKRYADVLDGGLDPTFNAWLEGAEPEDRRVGVWVAAALGADTLMSGLLLSRLRDSNAAARISALHASHEYLREADLNKLRESDVKHKLAQRYNLAEKCGFELRNPTQTTRSRYPRQTNPHVRYAAALAIADNGQDRNAPILVRGLADDDWFVRFVCAKGLERLNPGAASLAIGNPEQPDPHPWVQRVIERIRERARQAPTRAD
jgi:HEAT repeat protein